MKLLYMELDGLKFLNDGKVKIDYLCNTKVANEQIGNEVTQIHGPIYVNNVMAFSGINASGKTTVLRLQQLVNNIIFREDKLSSLPDYQELFDTKYAQIKIVVFNNNKYQFYEAHISNYIFIKEYASFCDVRKFKSKKQLDSFICSFVNNEIQMEKIDRDIESYKNISREISLLGSFQKQRRDYSTHRYTNFNRLGFIETPIALEIIKLLDDNIEYIKYIDELLLELKFYSSEKIIGSHQVVSSYLSSGTIKGITLFEYAFMALATGSYYWVDEIELHLHKTIVLKIIELFTNKNTNPNGATLVFTTHYSEILDHMKRHDAIYIMQKNKKSLTVGRMSDMYRRNDVKNSKLYLSGVFNSAPSYADYVALKRKLIYSLKDGE